MMHIDQLLEKFILHPTEIGVHYLNAKFGSDIVPGTPIKMYGYKTFRLYPCLLK